MLKILNLGTILIGGFVLVVFIAGTIGIIGIDEISQVAVKGALIHEEVTAPISDLAEIDIGFNRNCGVFMKI